MCSLMMSELIVLSIVWDVDMLQVPRADLAAPLLPEEGGSQPSLKDSALSFAVRQDTKQARDEAQAREEDERNRGWLGRALNASKKAVVYCFRRSRIARGTVRFFSYVWQPLKGAGLGQGLVSTLETLRWLRGGLANWAIVIVPGALFYTIRKIVLDKTGDESRAARVFNALEKAFSRGVVTASVAGLVNIFSIVADKAFFGVGLTIAIFSGIWRAVLKDNERKVLKRNTCGPNPKGSTGHCLRALKAGNFFDSPVSDALDSVGSVGLFIQLLFLFGVTTSAWFGVAVAGWALISFLKSYAIESNNVHLRRLSVVFEKVDFTLTYASLFINILVTAVFNATRDPDFSNAEVGGTIVGGLILTAFGLAVEAFEERLLASKKEEPEAHLTADIHMQSVHEAFRMG